MNRGIRPQFGDAFHLLDKHAHLTNFSLPSQFTNLMVLNLKSNLLTTLTSPANLTK